MSQDNRRHVGSTRCTIRHVLPVQSAHTRVTRYQGRSGADGHEKTDETHGCQTHRVVSGRACWGLLQTADRRGGSSCRPSQPRVRTGSGATTPVLKSVLQKVLEDRGSFCGPGNLQSFGRTIERRGTDDKPILRSYRCLDHMLTAARPMNGWSKKFSEKIIYFRDLGGVWGRI